MWFKIIMIIVNLLSDKRVQDVIVGAVETLVKRPTNGMDAPAKEVVKDLIERKMKK